MKVVLIKDLRGLGRKDDVKNVPDGYARNFLIPHGVVKPATGKELERLDIKKQNLKDANAKIEKILKELHRETQSAPISVPIKTGSKGEIFSSIKEAEVRQVLMGVEPRLGNFEFDIKLEKHIKDLGVHEIEINAGRGIKNTLKIKIVPLASN
jgi:large subunit ribosomal protein L9